MTTSKKSTKKSLSLARQRIVESSLKLFYKYGINNVGTDRIIKESNVAKMTLFNHFPTKKDLIIEFLKARDEIFIKWFEETTSTMKTNGNKNTDNALEVIKIWISSTDFNGCAFINTIAILNINDHKEKMLCIEHKIKFTNIIYTLALEDGIKEAKLFSEIFVTFIDGVTVKAQREGADSANDALFTGAKIILESFR